MKFGSMVMLAMLVAGAGLATAASAQGVLNGGFLGTYYATPDFSGTPSFQRRDVRINFNWTASGAGGSTTPEYVGVGTNGLSVSWLGSVTPATSETYSFSVALTGSLNLSIRPTGTANWTSLIADAGGTGQRTDQASYAMTAGQSYDLQIQYAQPAATGTIQLSWGSPTVPTQIIDPATPMGLNIGYAGPNDPNLIFADAVKQAYNFQIYTDHTDASHPAEVDANGWPMTDATLPIWTTHTEPGGTYNLRFIGQSQVVDWLGAGSFSSGGKVYGTVIPSGVGFDPTTDTTSVSWTIGSNAPATAVWFGFGATRRVVGGPGGTGVTKVQLLRPISLDSATSHAPGETFTAEFKTLLNGFTAIRFMDYLATLDNEQVNWTDRIKPTDYSQYQATSGYGYQGKGGAWEYLVELANETGKDVWINIPLNASDDYVTKVAQLLAYGSDGANPYNGPEANPVYPPLNSNLRVYIEYSNEIWNDTFLQHQQLRTAANAEVAAGNTPLNYDGTTDASVWFKRRIAERIKQISDLFRGVWGSPAMLTTIRPVYEFEYGDAGAYGQVGLDFLDAYFDNGDGTAHVANPVPVNSYIWGAGAGWYSTINNDGAASISDMYASGLSSSVISTTITNAVLARTFGLQPAGYEGGFYVGNESGSTSASQQALQLQANYASAAATLETETIDLFHHYGGALPFIFNSVGSTYGVAGPTLHEQNTPKLQGIATSVGLKPAAPLVGSTVPATLPVAAAAIASGTTAMTGDLALPTQYIDWSLNIAATGSFTIATDTTTPAAQVIYVDGVPTGPGPWTGTLTAGLHGIRIQDIAPGGMTLQNLLVTASGP